jgi:hypothetical protein
VRSRQGAVVVACAVLAIVAGAGASGAAMPARTPVHLDRIAVRQSDVVPADRALLYPGGNRYRGYVSLDLCNGSFPSEAARVGRHQVGVANAQRRPVGLSTEAIAYPSPAVARGAMAELRRAVADCTPELRDSQVAGEPRTRNVIGAPPAATWPTLRGVDRLAVDDRIEAETGESVHSQQIYQRHGRVIVAIYAQIPGGLDALRGRPASLQGFAATMARRLVAAG